MIAAALASRPLQFFTFDADCSYKLDPLSKQLESISEMLKTKTIGKLSENFLIYSIFRTSLPNSAPVQT